MDTLRRYWPAMLTFAVSMAYVLFRLGSANWDALSLVELAEYSAGGTKVIQEGYDGQFVYHIAIDPSPEDVASKLDVPAYRYQRILYPILARVMALGNPAWIPWTLILINLIAHFIGTAGMVSLLQEYQIWIGYALIYGLWVGLIAPIGLDLTEPLAYALAILGLLARKRSNNVLGAIFLTLALFAKETTVLFWLAALVADLLSRDKWSSVLQLGIGGAIYAIWQMVTFLIFGSFGLGSGGAMATSFELIPFMGLWRIGTDSLPVLGLFLVIFGPTVLIPTVWALIASIRALLHKDIGTNSWSLLFNALVIVVLPFSTFREPLGLVRIATGLVLATTCFAAEFSIRRALNYGMFWIAMLVILING